MADNKWWRAGEEYNFDVREKIQKEGCRGIRRVLIECQNARKVAGNCQAEQAEYDECSKFLEYINLNTKKLLASKSP